MLKAVVVAAESWLVLLTLSLAVMRHVLATLSWKLELLVVGGAEAGKLTLKLRVEVLELLMVQIHSVVMMLVVVVLAVAVVVDVAADVASLQRMDLVYHIVVAVVVEVVGVVDSFADVAVELDAMVIVAAVGGDVDSAAVDGDEDCVVADVDVDFVVSAAVVAVNEREVVAAAVVVAHDVAVEFVVVVAGLDLPKLV